MSATELIPQIEKLPDEEQQEIFIFLTNKVLKSKGAGNKRWLGKKLSFDEACDVVFREDRELLSALAT